MRSNSFTVSANERESKAGVTARRMDDECCASSTAARDGGSAGHGDTTVQAHGCWHESSSPPALLANHARFGGR